MCVWFGCLGSCGEERVEVCNVRSIYGEKYLMTLDVMVIGWDVE